VVARLCCTLPLPANYRLKPILAFHRRDTQEIAERVGEKTLMKALVWRGAPALLAIRFDAGQVDACLSIDGGASRDSRSAFVAMVERMLGLTQKIDEFEARFRDHPQVGLLIAHQGGLRVPVAATPFEALSWAVAAQQISMSAAVALRRNLILAAGIRHSGDLFCHPEAPQVAAMDEGLLRRAGFSNAKAQTMLTLARMAADGALPLDAWLQTLPVEEIVERLAALRGIGPWTINYALLRGFGWLDGSLHGDVAVRRGVQTLLGLPDKPSQEQVRVWLAEFSPWRALVAAHLWAAQTQTAG
jgi:DNA-3-methyladenine glycosylase II